MKRPLLRLGLTLATAGIVTTAWIYHRSGAAPGAMTGFMPARSLPVAAALRVRPPASLALPAQAAVDRMISGLRRWTELDNIEEQDRLEHELETALTDETAPAFLRALPPELRERSPGIKALEHWARHEPAAALAWLAGLPGGPSGTQVDLVVRNWLGSDLAGLKQHLAALPAGAWKEHLLSAASYGALLQDRPEDAVRWLSEMPDGKRDPAVMDWAARDWAKKDPAAAAAWAAGQPDAGSQNRLLIQVAQGYVRLNPQEAVAFIGNVFPAGETLDRAAEAVATAWAETDPAGAADWAARIPGDDPRRDTLRLLLGAWADRDPEAAQAWVRTRPAGPERDAWLGQLAITTLQSDPARAIALVESISSDTVQETTGAGIVRQWARDDYEKATAWVLRLPDGSLRRSALAELEAVITEDHRNG